MKSKASLPIAAPSAGPSSEPAWYRDAVFYELRVPSFFDCNGDGIGDLRGLAEKLDYLEDLGVTTLWLLPFYPSPLKDDGYDIAHYTSVHPDLGTVADFKTLLKEAHRRGLRVVTELVLNHTSELHPWFQRARRALPGSRQRDFYVWNQSAERYPEARIIFKDFERSNWTWDPVAKAYYWHRFYSHQPDLNFDNPAVRKALLEVCDFWMGLGVDGLRLDAIPYLYERDGTNCENLPETYGFLTELRRHLDRRFKGRMLLAEANQWPEDAALYLGADRCHMAFHFPMMPRLFMALHMEDRFPLVDILAQTPTLSDACQWALFLRNHDELTLEMVTDEERDYMYEAYAPEPGMRINVGIRRRLAPLVENDRRRIELLNALLFSMPGTPVLYYGDEIGMGDNIHLGDRNGVRTPMQWSSDRNAGFSRANPQRLFLPVIIDPEYHYEAINVETQQRNPSSLLWWMKRLIALRKQHRAFGRGSFEMLRPDNRRVLVYVRELAEERDEKVLVVANLSRFAQSVSLDLSRYQGLTPTELFGRTEFPTIGAAPYPLTLAPHAFFWFALERGRSALELASVAAPEAPELRSTASWEKLVESRDKALERTLAAYLPRCRWFVGKARSLRSVRIGGAIPVTDVGPAAYLLWLEAVYTEGLPDSYLVPVGFTSAERGAELAAKSPAAVIARATLGPKGTKGIIYDAVADQGFCQELLDLFRRRRRSKAAAGEVVPSTLTWARQQGTLTTDLLEARVLGGEQSNTSIVFGDRLILKLQRRLTRGLNPGVEVSRFLTERTEVGCTPKLAGWLDHRPDRGEPATLATLYAYVPNAGDAWQWTGQELKRYFERAAAAYPRDEKEAPVPPASPLVLLDQEPPRLVTEMIGPYLNSAQLMGRRTAELHLALASDTEDPEFAPEPYGTLYQRSVYQSMRNIGLQTLRQLRGSLAGLSPEVRPEADAVLAAERTILERFEVFRARKITVTRMRHHGDFHLGQLLFTGRDFLIIDFEGEPLRPLADRRRKRSCLRDVAGMMRSLHYAAVSALHEQQTEAALREADVARLEPWAKIWSRWTARSFLRAYLDAAGPAPFIPKERDELKVLLDVFLLEKALYEVAYELASRPAWLRIPLRGIRNIIHGEGADG